MSDAEEKRGFVLEPATRLSKSKIWSFQRHFFDERGHRAWSERVVPTHVTSNAFIADAYARVVFRFLRECALLPEDSPFALDPERPVNIVELGAGSGYFGFLFLNKLIDLRELAPFPLPQFRYVVTDFTQSNVDFWRDHPCFQPFVEYGLVDFARFDAEKDESIELSHSDETLAPGKTVNPIVVIANYVFDSLVHDVFRVQAGAIEEGRAVLHADTAPETTDNPLDSLQVDYEYRTLESPAYGDPTLDGILEEYSTTIGDTSLPIPVGAVQCLGNLERLANDRMLLLSADKGYTSLEQLGGLGDPHIVHHGSVSMMVNYHALIRRAEARGGFGLAASDREASLEVVALGTTPLGNLPETQLAFEQVVERFGPVDTYFITNMPMAEKVDLEQLLTVMRLSSWDPFTFSSIVPAINRAIPDAHASTLRRLRKALKEVWRLYFPLDGRDVAFDLGYIYFALSHYPEARYFYGESLRFNGPHQTTHFNLGLCEYKLGQIRRALEHMERALEVEPTYGPARDWRVRLTDELREQPLLPQVPFDEAETRKYRAEPAAAEPPGDSEGPAETGTPDNPASSPS
jgi:tetratricopeptide (TPR) repeat protein